MIRRPGAHADASGRASRLTPKVRRTFFALLLAMTISAMDYTIVSTALPTIVGEMGALTLLPWVLTANVLASTVTVPLYGKLSDLYGRRRLMQVAILLFVLGSSAAGLSEGIGQLIAFRAVQGAGSAGLISLSYMIVGDIITPRQRGRYQAYISAVFAVASFCGPLVGGLAVDHFSWRLAFYPSVLLAIITLVVIRRNLTDPQVTRGIGVDWLGAALLALGLAAFLLVATWAGREHAWDSPVIVSTAAVGVLALLWFVRQEGRAPSPILPLFLFRNREFSAANATSFIAGFGLFLPLAYFPVFLQLSLGMSATHSGLLLVPMLTASLVASLVSGRIVARWGRYRSVVTAGCVLLGVGLTLISTMTVSTSPQVAAVYLLVFGLSMGILIPCVGSGHTERSPSARPGGGDIVRAGVPPTRWEYRGSRVRGPVQRASRRDPHCGAPAGLADVGPRRQRADREPGSRCDHGSTRARHHPRGGRAQLRRDVPVGDTCGRRGHHRRSHAEGASPPRRSPTPTDGSRPTFGRCSGRAHPALPRRALQIGRRRMTAPVPSEECAGRVGRYPGTRRFRAGHTARQAPPAPVD